MEHCENYAKACTRRDFLKNEFDRKYEELNKLISSRYFFNIGKAQKLSDECRGLLKEWSNISDWLAKERLVSFISCHQGEVVLVVKNDDNVRFKIIDFVNWYNNEFNAELLPEELIEEPYAVDEEIMAYVWAVLGFHNARYDRIEYFIDSDYDGLDPTWYQMN